MTRPPSKILDSAAGGRTGAHRAMTIIEVIVVVVILGILATMTIPRLVGSEARRVAAKAEQVAQVLTAMARRDAVLSQALALEYDTEAEVVRILVRSRNRDAREPWVTDRLLPDAELNGVLITAVEVDGADIDPEGFRVVLDQSAPRPALRLVLSSARGEHAHTVEMAGTAGQAQVVSGDQRGRGLVGASSASVDLDAEGKDRSAW